MFVDFKYSLHSPQLYSSTCLLLMALLTILFIDNYNYSTTYKDEVAHDCHTISHPFLGSTVCTKESTKLRNWNCSVFFLAELKGESSLNLWSTRPSVSIFGSRSWCCELLFLTFSPSRSTGTEGWCCSTYHCLFLWCFRSQALLFADSSIHRCLPYSLFFRPHMAPSSCPSESRVARLVYY